jgi:histone deacetylase 11
LDAPSGFEIRHGAKVAMKVLYDDAYNIDLGLLNFAHPFEGRKFRKVADALTGANGAFIESPKSPVPTHEIDLFSDALLKLLLRKKRYILRALEVPYLPLVPMSFLDRRILSPMRWGVAGTLRAAREALGGACCWNLAGGYHHASRGSAEGFCIYNDIGITVDILTRERLLADDAHVLIVDVDAHHGNGNAHVFMEKSTDHDSRYLQQRHLPDECLYKGTSGHQHPAVIRHCGG